jgi:hypothetical protein
MVFALNSIKITAVSAKAGLKLNRSLGLKIAFCISAFNTFKMMYAIADAGIRK